MQDDGKPDGGSGPDDKALKSWIFEDELGEVYLLLDYLSGRPDRHLSELDNKVPWTGQDGKTTMLGSAAVLDKVSELRYPPEGTASQQAKDAAFLLNLKDVLNSLAYPARGLTIAYTTMFTNSGSRGGQKRVALAMETYPALAPSARTFRYWNLAFNWTAVIVTVLAAVLLGYVSHGVQLAARFDDARKNELAATAKLYDQLNKSPNAQAKGDAPNLEQLCRIPRPDQHQASSRAVPAPPTPGPAAAPAAAARAATPEVPGAAPPTAPATARVIDSEVRQLCNDFVYRHALYCVAINDIGAFGHSWPFRIATFVLPMHQIDQSDDCKDKGGETTTPQADAPGGQEGSGAGKGAGGRSNVPLGRQEDAPSIGAALAMMSNYLLPILFGLVGTSAALVRGIQDKVTNSTLSPRDKALMLIRLPLGMVAGVSVGLFLTPSSVSSQASTSLGAFTLTASGIAFLAGYGAEGFFKALDGLIGRIFEPPARKA